jgi:hypothetical protein
MVEQNRVGQRSKLLANAQQALAKHLIRHHPLIDKDQGDIFWWVPKAKVPGS